LLCVPRFSSFASSQLRSRLFRRKVEHLVAKAGDTLRCCAFCGELFCELHATQLSCPCAPPRVGFRGDVSAPHVAVEARFNANELLLRLRVRGLSWSGVYWYLRGCTLVARCRTCDGYFQLHAGSLCPGSASGNAQHFDVLNRGAVGAARRWHEVDASESEAFGVLRAMLRCGEQALLRDLPELLSNAREPRHELLSAELWSADTNTHALPAPPELVHRALTLWTAKSAVLSVAAKQMGPSSKIKPQTARPRPVSARVGKADSHLSLEDGKTPRGALEARPNLRMDVLRDRDRDRMARLQAHLRTLRRAPS
jgi:hypothetical protein